MALVAAAFQFSNAQISYGIKGGMNIDLNGEASDYIELPDGISIESEGSNGGYHAGAWLRVKIPLLGLYVRPEVIYTDLSSEYTLKTNIPTFESTKIENTLTKIDVPVLLGMKFLSVGNVFLGPNMQYTLKSESTTQYGSLDSVEEEISFGLVIGAGLEFWKLGVDVRFETGFASPDSLDFTTIDLPEDLEPIMATLSGQKPNQLIVGLSYKF